MEAPIPGTGPGDRCEIPFNWKRIEHQYKINGKLFSLVIVSVTVSLEKVGSKTLGGLVAVIPGKMRSWRAGSGHTRKSEVWAAGLGQLDLEFYL